MIINTLQSLGLGQRYINSKNFDPPVLDTKQSYANQIMMLHLWIRILQTYSSENCRLISNLLWINQQVLLCLILLQMVISFSEEFCNCYDKDGKKLNFWLKMKEKFGRIVGSSINSTS